MEELLDKYTGTISWQTGNDLGDWIFGKEPAETGDMMVDSETGTETETETKKPAPSKTETGTAKETETETETEKSTENESSTAKTYKTFKITIYMLRTESSLDTSITNNMAYLITDDQAAAEKFLEAFKKNKTHSRDEFVRIAEEHYDALHASHDHSDENAKEPTFSYASVDNAKKKYFADAYGALNLWLEDEARVDGEYIDTKEKIIKIEVTNSDKSVTTYYAVLLLEGDGEMAWYADAFAGATQKRINEWYENAIKQYPITINQDALDDIL